MTRARQAKAAAKRCRLQAQAIGLLWDVCYPHDWSAIYDTATDLLTELIGAVDLEASLKPNNTSVD